MKKESAIGVKSYEKPQDKNKTIKILMHYLLKHKVPVFMAIFLTVASNVLLLAGPFLTGEAINAIGDERGVQFTIVFILCGILVLFYVLSSLFTYFLNFVMADITRKMIVDIRKDLNRHLLNMNVKYFDQNTLGDILSRMTYDIDTIGISLTNDIVQVASTIISIVISFIMMCIISLPLMIIFVFSIPLSIIFTRIITKRNRRYFMDRSKKLGKMNGFVEEMFTAQKTIKVYGLEEKICEDFVQVNIEARDSTSLAEIHGSRVGPSMNFINNIVLALIAVLGMIYLGMGVIEIGAITSFILYSKKFTGPINEVFNIYADILSALAASERVFSILDEPQEENKGAEVLNDVQGNIEINHVSFGYDENQRVLKGIDFKVNQGEMIAIVGQTGCGKTTLINLLMRFYRANQGEFLLEQKNILDLELNHYRLNYSMILQDTWLFEGSFYENIAYGNKDITLEKVKESAQKALIDDFIEKMPDGYDTVVNDNAINISVGQKQQIVIARALLSDSKILILDEATSNVDTLTEVKIQKAMMNLMNGKTCFVIAHRLSTIKNADKIVVMKEGKILEVGKHQELLEMDGYYKEIYMSQFQKV